jgi:signal transduction histidine kinase
MRGMEFFLVQRERDLLLGEKMFALQRMMMTDRLVSLGIFAAGLNHHIRNSLTAVKTFLDLAPSKLRVENLNIDHLRNPEYWQDFYATVQEQMQKVIQVLQDVKEIPEPPTLPLEETLSINVLVRDALAAKQSAFSSRRLRVIPNFGELSPVIGNSQMLRRAVEFILQDEAINVCLEGTVTVTTADHVNSGVKGVLISISDNGPDIPLSVLHCVFDPFFVRRNLPQEYGLNLLTAFFLVYHHNGTVSIKSNNPGALFEIFIPLDPRAAQSSQDQAQFLERVFSTEKVWEKMLIQD